MIFLIQLTLLLSCTIPGSAAVDAACLYTSSGITQGAEEDHVYMAKDVDVKAKITNRTENIPEVGRDCPRQGLVTLKVTLHKSGEVTEVKIMKGMGCSYDEATVAAARKFKFTPAVKDDRPVSQYQIVEYVYQ